MRHLFFANAKKTLTCLFLKIGYSTKCYYCRLWDFKLVDVNLVPRTGFYLVDSDVAIVIWRDLVLLDL